MFTVSLGGSDSGSVVKGGFLVLTRLVLTGMFTASGSVFGGGFLFLSRLVLADIFSVSL